MKDYFCSVDWSVIAEADNEEEAQEKAFEVWQEQTNDED